MENKRKFGTRDLTACAVLVAMYVVLKYMSFDVLAVKFSFAPFPVLVAALLFGPLSGLAVGALGEGISQMISYGFTVTTILWILPVALRGLFTGLWAKNWEESIQMRSLILCVLLVGLFVTLLNTGLLYLDGIIYGYPVQYTCYAIIMRFVSSVAMTAIYCALLPKTVWLVRRAINR